MKGSRRGCRVLLIDQESMLRDALRALLSSQERLSIGHVVDGTEQLRALAADSGFAPDIIIVDFAAPGVDPRETVELARRHWPDAPILVLTLDRRQEAIETALRLGANGYLLKSDKRTDLLSAIHSVLVGRRHISPAVFDTVVSGFVHPDPGAGQKEPDGLSERERQVLKLIAAGLRTREIAEKLCVSFKTADKHRTNLMRKLGVRTAAAVAAYAILNGYFP